MSSKAQEKSSAPTPPSSFEEQDLAVGLSIRQALATSVPPLGASFTACEGGTWQRGYRFAPEDRVFAGHFPQRPILPAVVQCLMGQMLVEEGLQRPLRLKAIVQAKFTRVTGPDEDIIVSVKAAATEGQWDCTVQAGGESAARIRLQLEELL